MEKSNHWTVTKENKTDEGEVYSVYVEDEFGNKASFKWDGCIDLHHNDTYIHICDVDDMIQKLQEIKQTAKSLFREDNFETYWNNSQ